MLATSRRNFLRLLPVALAPATRAAPDLADTPLELVWLLPSEPLSAETWDAYVRVATDPLYVVKSDAFAVLTVPPTFPGYNEDFLGRLQRLATLARRPLLYATFPVGLEGWETSNHRALSEKLFGAFHEDRNLPADQWFEALRAVRQGIWGLTIESLPRLPSAEEVRGYIRAFCAAAHSECQKAAVWYTAAWERYQPAGAIVRAVFGPAAAPAVPPASPRRRQAAGTRPASSAAAEPDYVVWMDTRALLEDAGEDGVRKRIAEIVELTGERSIFQIGFFGPDEEAFSRARQFMRLAIEGGVNRFALYVHPARFETRLWREMLEEIRR